MLGWINISEIGKAISERARRVNFRGQSPNEEWMGEVEVMPGPDGTMEIHVSRSHLKKYSGKKWHTESLYVTISAATWEHLKSAPTTTNLEV